MRFSLTPLPAAHFVLRIDTPIQLPTEQEVQDFFRECTWTLAWQEEQGNGVYGIVVGLNSTVAIAPPSVFLTALCKFVAEHPFEFCGGQDIRDRLRLIVGVVSTAANDVDNAADSTSRFNDEDVYAEATSRICCAFWQNEVIRVTRYMAINVPFVPSQELVNLLVVSTGSGVGVHDHDGMPGFPLVRSGNSLNVTLIAGDHHATHRDIVQVELAGSLGLCAVGTNIAAALMDRVLKLFDSGSVGNSAAVGGPTPRRHAKVIVASESVAEAVASRFHEHGTCPTINLRTIRLVAGTTSNLDNLLPRVDDFECPYMDGTSVFRAALSIPSVTCLVIAGFRLMSDLSSSSDVSTFEAHERDPPAAVAAPVYSLTLEECRVSDDFLASLVLQVRSLQLLKLLGARVPPPAMAALCRALATDAAQSLQSLQMGRGSMDSANCLEDESVELFFRALPTLKHLRTLLLNHDVAAHLAQTVVDGVKDNYWIQWFMVQSFEEVTENVESDDDSREVPGRPNDDIECYLYANAEGRRAAVYDAAVALQEATAATTGDDRHGAVDDDDVEYRRRWILEAKVGAALRALEGFATAGEHRGNVTCRYLCVRMFLPAALGGSSSVSIRSSNDVSGLTQDPVRGSTANVPDEKAS